MLNILIKEDLVLYMKLSGWMGLLENGVMMKKNGLDTIIKK